MTVKITCCLYLTTSLVYGSVISLMPLLCSQVFGPSTHSHATLLQQEQATFLQRVQMAITLYESYVFRIGTIGALIAATCLIYFLDDSSLIWTGSGLLISAAYAISAFSSYHRFKPDLMTTFNNAAAVGEAGRVSYTSGLRNSNDDISVTPMK